MLKEAKMAQVAMKDELVLGEDELRLETEKVVQGGEEPVTPSSVDSDDLLSDMRGIQDDEIDVPHPFDDDTEEDSHAVDDEAEEEDEPKAASSKQGSTVRYKANGKWYEIDLSDVDGLKEKLSMAEGARPAFTKADVLEKKVAELEAKLEEASKNANLSALEVFERQEGKSFDQVVEDAMRKKEAYQNASTEERQIMEFQERVKRLEEIAAKQKMEAESAKKALEEEKAAIESRANEAQERELRAILTPAFAKYEYSKKVSNPEMAEQLNDMLWNQALLKIEREQGDDVEVTPAIAARAFRDVAKLLDRNAKEAAEESHRRVTSEKKKTAEKDARLASTRNYSNKKFDAKKAAKLAKDPVALMDYMLGGRK